MLLLENNGKIINSKIQDNKVNNLLHESDPLTDFIRVCLVLDEKANVTTAELVEAFYAFCKEQGWDLLPQRLVEKELPDYVYQTFGFSRRTDVKRAGTNRRGYYGLRLRNK